MSLKVLTFVVMATAGIFFDLSLAQQETQIDDEIKEGKKEHVFANKRHLDIYLNEHVHDLMDQIEKSDKLSLVYFFNSAIQFDSNGQDWTILDAMFVKVLEELKGGYVTTYAIDCNYEHKEVDPKVNFKHVCQDREEFQPIFTLYKPPEIKVNPYTGKTMPVTPIPFASNQVSDPDVRKWITDNVPDYTQRLMTREDADQFAAESGIQKVYLFSSKQKVPPIYKALSTNYRNRLRFAFVNIEAVVAKELATEFDVSNWPTLLVQNQFATPD